MLQQKRIDPFFSTKRVSRINLSFSKGVSSSVVQISLRESLQHSLVLGGGKLVEALADGVNDGLKPGRANNDAHFFNTAKPAWLEFGGRFYAVGGAALEFGDARQFPKMIAGAASDHDDGLHLRKQVRENSPMNMHNELLALCYKVYRQKKGVSYRALALRTISSRVRK
jgi:hypothetical protein